ncbi:PAS domain-containing protein [Algoriphagus sp. D3-2-R+10]|uniref:PAS domain-containing protein n=1 Tax=Algoriphagus aurantiacus TaxID=3103948 RepID=UPI002B3F539A|nr:PAS domain-containing protein [Algoriphagus sp. D3-2-R+10]MEB2776051.1 PAS domain-containing protein [Algoriphagus sp. D3-2-R+10]
MNDYDAIQALSHLAVVSDYFLQVTLDKTGRVIASDSGIGPVPTFFDNKKKPIYFADCFVASNWGRYESQRIKAWNNSHQSFTVTLQKIVHPQGDLIDTTWEFYFISEDFGTCLGIGHPVNQPMPYNFGLGDFFDSTMNEGKEIIDSILEDKLIGFWEFDLAKKEDKISQGLGQMLGYTQAELAETTPISWQKHIHPEDFPNLLRDLGNHFKTPGNIPFKKEFRITQKTNQTIWALGFGKTIEWSKIGRPTKIAGCILDISDRKKHEIWLKEHQYFLKELAFEQSHTLRARVANILGILEILDSEPQNNESKRLVELIKKETKLLDQSLKKSIKESVQINKSIENDLSNDINSSTF